MHYIYQASEAGLPPPVRGHDDTETKLKTEEDQLTTAHLEMTAGQSKSECDTDHNLSEELRTKLSTNMTDQLVSVHSLFL